MQWTIEWDEQWEDDIISYVSYQYSQVKTHMNDMNNNFSHYLPLMSCLHYEGMLNGHMRWSLSGIGSLVEVIKVLL